jgi:hypothetical protein
MKEIMMNKTKTGTILLVLILFSGSLFSQTDRFRLQSDRISFGGGSYEFWKAEEDYILAFSFPFTFIYPYDEKLSFYATTSPAYNILGTGERYSLGGISDVKIGGHYLAFNDEYLFTFGLNLPVGKNALTTEEYAVANVLAMPAFNFRVPSLGQGIDVHVGASTARELGDLIVGAGISYLFKGGYKPLSDYDELYNPGDEITFTAGADRNLVLFNKDMQLTGDILLTMYFNDRWGGEKVFHSGSVFLIQLLSRFKVGSFDMEIFIRERMKGKNKTGAGSFFDTERKNSNSNQFEIHGIAVYPWKPNLLIKGAGEIKLYSNNQYDTGGAKLIGVGGGGEWQILSNLRLIGDTRFYIGSIKSGARNAFTLGFKFYGGFQFTF